MKTCPKCKIEKELKEFSNNKSRSDGKQRMCKLCSSKSYRDFWIKHGKEKISKINERNKIFFERINKIKEEKKCAKCNENRYWVLDFHHLDPKEKDFNISNASNFGQYKVLQEIEKCIVLCSNCHRDFHYKEKNNNLTIQQYI